MDEQKRRQKEREIVDKLRAELRSRPSREDQLQAERRQLREMTDFAVGISEVTGDDKASILEDLLANCDKIAARKAGKTGRGHRSDLPRRQAEIYERKLALEEFRRKRQEANDYLRKIRNLAKADPDIKLPAELLIDVKKLDTYSKLLKDNDRIALYYRRMAEEINHLEMDYDEDGRVREIPSKTLTNKAYAISHCAHAWNFDDYPVSWVKDLKSVSYCHDRFCPLCQKKQADARFVKYDPLLFSLSQKYQVCHLTLTQPNVNGDDLIGELDRMFSSLKTLARYFSGNARIKGSLFGNLGYYGMARSLEITIPRPGEFHPHFHIVLLLRKGLDFPAVRVNRYSYSNTDPGKVRKFSDLEIFLQKVWYLLMNGQEVNMTAINALELGYSCQCTPITDAHGYKEVFKYAIKPSKEEGYSYLDFKIMYKAVRSRRIFQGYGGLYHLKDVDPCENHPRYDLLVGQLREIEQPVPDYRKLSQVYDDLKKGIIIISRKFCDVVMEEDGTVRKLQNEENADNGKENSNNTI